MKKNFDVIDGLSMPLNNNLGSCDLMYRAVGDNETIVNVRVNIDEKKVKTFVIDIYSGPYEHDNYKIFYDHMPATQENMYKINKLVDNIVINNELGYESIYKKAYMIGKILWE